MLRKALASLLYSPLRFLLAVLAAGCLLLGSFLVLDHGSHQREAVSTTTEHQDGSAQPAAADRSPAPSDSESRQPADQRAPMRVLKRFLDAYLIGDKEGRYSSRELQRVTTPALWRGLKVADRGAVPLGRAEHLQQALSGAYAAEYVVSLDSGDRVVVDLVLTSAGWRVCDVEPGQGP